VLELVAQINHFLRSKLLQSTSSSAPLYNNTAGRYQYGRPADFVRQNLDWFGRDDARGTRLKFAITCLFRADSSIGFQFTVDGLKLFVIKFTEAGKELFGYPRDYLALGVDVNGDGKWLEGTVDANGVAITSFLTDAGVIQSTLPANLDEEHTYIFDKIVYLHHRNEVVIETSLPLNNIVEVHRGQTNYEQQLASYRIPHKGLQSEYHGTMFRIVKELRDTQYVLENFRPTQNEFLLTGTDLQNFHIRLVNRRYLFSEGISKKDHKPYELADNTFWWIQFLVTPI